MLISDFINHLETIGIGFYTGVPDSQLKAFCDFLCMEDEGSENHIIAANEGNAVGLAAGYYMATGKIPCVYMQNSGLGNAVNPIVSLINNKVYGIPMVFVIGWRGEPGIKDEPQHVFQGEITLKLLETLGIEYEIIDKDSIVEDLLASTSRIENLFSDGKSMAYVIKKDAFQSYPHKAYYKSQNTLVREEVLDQILTSSKDDIIVSTTGKTSREVFEIRERRGESHERDFLTVGSMGHSSSIALGIALNTSKRVWCLDGDGAMLMHMGSMALAGSMKPENFIHVVLNNGAHESVGGMPTVSNKINMGQIALACGYERAFEATGLDELKMALEEIANKGPAAGPVFLEIKIALGSRGDLGRPTSTPKENKKLFMDYIRRACK